MSEDKLYDAAYGLSCLFNELELTWEEREIVTKAELELIMSHQEKLIKKKSNIAAWTIPPAVVALASIIIIAIFR